MDGISQKTVFMVLVAITASCGVGSFIIAILPSISISIPNQNLDSLFMTFTHLFSGGVGAIMAMVANRK